MTEPPTPQTAKEKAVRFHHLHQKPVAGLGQRFRVYRPFTGRGIGVVIWRHELSVTW